jgi:hypothetical protein
VVRLDEVVQPPSRELDDRRAAQPAQGVDQIAAIRNAFQIANHRWTARPGFEQPLNGGNRRTTPPPFTLCVRAVQPVGRLVLANWSNSRVKPRTRSQLNPR